jgi:integrase
MVSILYAYITDDLDISIVNPARGVRIEVGEEGQDESAVEVEDIYTDEEIDTIMATTLGFMEKARSRVNMRKPNTLQRARSATRDRAIVAMLIYCGLRIGEALALDWADIDFERSVLTVNKSLSKKGKVTAAKTRAGRRTVAIPETALNILVDAKAHSPFPIFAPSNVGNYIGYRATQKSWVQITKRGEVQYRNLHSLRHFYASKLIDAGYDDHRLTNMIGHEDIAFTRRVYGHLINRKTRVTKDVADINAVFSA